MTSLAEHVRRARKGDVEAFGAVVEATQTMVYAVALRVLKDPVLAEDAAQEAYVRAFRRLVRLDDDAAFPGWLRRIVVTVSLNMRRARRRTLLVLDDVADVPVLDEAETCWTELQRRRLAAAMMALTAEERRLCDRRYHGGWSFTRLAAEAGIDEAAMRKRLQRVRDKLRKEMEMAEQRAVRPGDIRPDFPAKIVELLARPQLTDLPENPVGRVLEMIRVVFPDCVEEELPEVIDLAEARKTIADVAMYIEPHELQQIDERHILRYDLTLPLLLTVRYAGTPLHVWSTGKCYRLCQTDRTHLEAFHQAEAFMLDDRRSLDPWHITGRVLQSMDRLLPGRAVKIVPVEYPMCTQAWELEVDADGQWDEVLAWGVFNDRIVSHVGGDPKIHTAVGVGYGLERLAMVRYGINDARTIDVASVA